MRSRLGGLVAAARAADAAEFEQALIRIVNQVIVCAYFIAAFAYGKIPQHGELLVFGVGPAAILVTLGIVAWILAKPGANPLRRCAGAVNDMTATSAVLLLTDEIGTILYPVYLWVIIGNGFRFGRWYLYFSQALALAGFAAVLAFNPYWHEHRVLGAAFVLGLLAVPLYALMLILRLNAANRRLEEARREAESANLSKTRFLAAASHDLRQPMQALSMYASVLDQKIADSGVRQALNGVALSVRTLEQLFDSLLDVSKIETGVIRPRLASFALMPLIERVVEVERLIAEQKNLEIRVVPTAVSVRSDPLLLERMLKNLVTNAVRYTARGGIVVGCRRAPGGRVRLVVADTGIGIASEEQSRIFDEYYQIEGSSVQGLGLGLTIVKSLGHLLRHPVGVKSRLGRGSAFSIEIERASEAVPAPEAHAALPTDLAGLCVAVLDDDSEIRGALGLLLESWGCRCIAGATLAEAQAKLRAADARPRALIVDFRLAESVTGLEAIRRLRDEFGAEIPALVITGTHHAAGLPEGGGIPVLTKPASPAKLRAFLSEAVRTPGRSEPGWRRKPSGAGA